MAAFLLAATADWIAVSRGDKALEYIFKPLALAILVTAALTLDPENDAQRAWFVAALVFSLTGDIFLMVPRDFFVPGLASFLVAHLCFIAGFVVAGIETSAAVVAAVVAGALAAVALRRIVWSLEIGHHGALKAPVLAYAAAISAMVACAAGSHDPLALAGAASFYVSDLLIAWSRFVSDFRAAKILIIVTYHFAQLALVGSLAT